MSSSQEEADTKLILNGLDASEKHTYTSIVVRSPDTDVFLSPFTLSC